MYSMKGSLNAAITLLPFKVSKHRSVAISDISFELWQLPEYVWLADSITN